MPFQSSAARFGLGGGTVKITSLSLAASGAFVTRYDTTGNIQWAARITGNVGNGINGVAIDSSGNVYVVGIYYTTTATFFNANGTTFGTLAFSAATSGSNVFIAKYNSTGTVQWTARIFGTGSSEQGNGIGVDSSGNVYFVGTFTGSPEVWDGSGSFWKILSGGSAFLIKFNTNGIGQWSVVISGGSVYGIAVDTSGNPYIIGGYSSTTANFYSPSGTLAASVTRSTGSSATFTASYNTAGAIQWVSVIATATGGSTGGFVNGTAIAVDTSGNVYVMGNYAGANATAFNSNGGTYGTLTFTNNDIFVVKYASNGFITWFTRITGNLPGVSFYGIGVDSSGNVYLTGQYTSTTITIYNQPGTASFGTLSLTGTANTNYNCFIIKYNTSGTAQWATRIAGPAATAFEYGTGLSVDSSANVYVSGRYIGSPTTVYNLNGTTVFTTLAVATGTDAFVVKYNTNGAGQWAARMTGAGNDDKATSISTTGTGTVAIGGNYNSTTLTLYSTGF